MPSSLMIQERSYSTAIFLERASFQNIWRKYNISMYFLRQIIFILRLKNKIMFSEKRNIINLDDIRKVIFQCDFCGKTIFSEYLEKENMVFRAVPIVCKIISFFNISLIFSYILKTSQSNFSLLPCFQEIWHIFLSMTLSLDWIMQLLISWKYSEIRVNMCKFSNYTQ